MTEKQIQHTAFGSTAGSDEPGTWPGVFAGSKDGPNLEGCHMPTTTTPASRFRTVDGVPIRYADSGGSHGPAVVLTSPRPESVYAFKPIWASLSGHARLLAVGLPGFGACECPEDLLSPRVTGEFLARLIAGADLGAPRIVAPDVGTATAEWGGEADG